MSAFLGTDGVVGPLSALAPLPLPGLVFVLKLQSSSTILRTLHSKLNLYPVLRTVPGHLTYLLIQIAPINSLLSNPLRSLRHRPLPSALVSTR
jgi:hypothetical protein